MELSGAQIVIERLCAHGAATVFGYPGGSVLPIYDALYENARRVRHVITAHEQGAAHAADGYARASGKTGVVIATSGPGATNLVTGIANAYLDSVPLVAITGNVAVPLLGKDSFQEVDIAGITQPVVKHNFVVRGVKELEHTLNEAFRIANSGRRGPVLVDIPRDVQADTCEYRGGEPEKTDGGAAPFDVSRAVKAIKGCERPYIYAGGGILASGAQADLRALSERLSAPVGFSMMGLTALPDDYGLNLGMCGMHGTYAASVAQSECDLMLALGVRFSDRATGNIEAYRQGRVIIHVDIDLAEIGKNVSPGIDICGDVKAVLKELLRVLPPMKNAGWLSRVEELKQADRVPVDGGFTPKNIIETVSGFCDEDTIIATDVGQHQMWTMQYYPFGKPRTLLTSGGLGAMGFGLGAAIGGCMANGNRRTVLFTSDGSFGMNLTELATAVSQRLPITVVILNNGVLGMVRQWQTMFYGKRYSQTTLDRRTDFAALARAFGAEGYRAKSLMRLTGILERLPADGPAVIDCRIDMDEKVLPMIPPGGSVKNIMTRG
ncbi:MAG: biosynthetic-type acetolactate synthase large subunit [Firmicutes bacterium]|nr:biosynthetic-type acetolactate synthase large subunit [Bacillota bacterium]